MDQPMCPWKKGAIAAVIIVGVIALIYVTTSESMTNYDYEGKFVKCIATQKIFLVQNGQKRYVSWPVYLKYGQPEPIEVPCRVVSPMPTGADLI